MTSVLAETKASNQEQLNERQSPLPVGGELDACCSCVDVGGDLVLVGVCL